MKQGDLVMARTRHRPPRQVVGMIISGPHYTEPDGDDRTETLEWCVLISTGATWFDGRRVEVISESR